jgi:4-amino-4-deoxy-L-arabinose transferase-like glycosyltransferase
MHVAASVSPNACTTALSGPRATVAAALFLAALVVFVPGLGEQHLWTKDEARPGLVAKEMRATGRWAVPHIGGRLYVEKPPLFMWTVALLSSRGVTEWTLRLPSVVAGAATVAATYLIGACLFGHAAGLVSAAALASCFTFFQWARTGRMEAMLTLWITLGAWSLVRWLDGRRPVDAAAFGLWLGLGILTKGPAALLIVAAALASVLLIAGARAGAARAAGLAALVAGTIVLIWVGTAAAVADDFLDYVIGIGPRLAHEITARPVRRVWNDVLLGLLPWTLALPAGAAVLLGARAEWRRRLPVPALWLASVLIVFTVFMQPREVYFLPAYPALAILIGAAWTLASPGARWALAGPPIALLVAAGAGAVLTAVAGATVRVHEAHVAIAPHVALASLALAAAAAIAAIVLLRRGREAGAGIALALGACALFLVFETRVHTPGVNLSNPVPAIAARLAARLPPTAEVAYVDRRRATAIVFYLPQRSIELGWPVSAGAIPDRPGLHVLIPESYLGTVPVTPPRRLVPLEHAALGGIGYVLAAVQ